MNYSGPLVRVHSQMVQSYARAEMIWQSSSVIINPRQEMWLKCEWRHAQKRWSWEFEDFKKTVVEIRPLRRAVSFLSLRCAVEFFGSRPAEMTWDLKHHKMRRAFGWGQHYMVSIDFWELCVSLSSCCHGPKPEINKPVRIWNERERLYLYMYLYYCCDWYHYGFTTIFLENKSMSDWMIYLLGWYLSSFLII